MPLATFDEIDGIDDQAPKASFADIAAIEPPASRAAFEDIAAIDPPQTSAPPRVVAAPPAPPPSVPFTPQAIRPMASHGPGTPAVPPTALAQPPKPAPIFLTPNPMPGDVAAPLGSVPVLDAPADEGGLPKVARGVRGLARAFTTPPAPPAPTEPVHRSRTGALYTAPPPMAESTKAAFSDVLEGGAHAALPLVVGAGLGAPAATALTVGAATGVSAAATKAAEIAGASPETQRLVGNLAALAAAAGVGSDQILRLSKDTVIEVGQRTRAAGNRAVAARESARTIVPDDNVIDVSPVKPEPKALPPAPIEPEAPAAGPVAAPPSSPGPRAPGPEGAAPPPVASFTDIARIEPPQEPDHAAGIQSANPVDVRHASGDGEALGGGDAVVQPPPGARVPEQGGTPAGEAPPPAAEIDEAARHEAERLRAPEPPAPGVAHVDDIASIEPPVDRLDTGELQPRLPGAGDVRQVGKADTSFTAPVQASGEDFGLTHETSADVAKRDAEAAKGGDLFAQPAEPPAPLPAPAAKPKRAPWGVRERPVEWRELDPVEQRELRRIHEEMSIPYSKKNFTEARKGGSPDVHGGAGGAPVYWDIVGGNPDQAQPTFRYSRGQVEQKLAQFIQSGQRSVVSDLAVDVARRRLGRDASLSHPSLPPTAGDLPGGIHVVPNRDLEPDGRRVEQAAAERLQREGPALVTAYRRQFGSDISTDHARELLLGKTDAATQVAHNWPLQRPAVALKEAIYRQAIHEAPGPGQGDLVVIRAGGPGAGKGHVVTAVPGIRDAMKGAKAVNEGTFSRFDVAKRDIDQALDAGNQVVYLYVHRDPVEAFANGVLRREGAEFRPVRIDYHLAAHAGALETAQQVAAAYKDDPRVEVVIIKNTSEPGGAQLADVTGLRGLRYDQADVRQRIEAAVADAHRTGRLSDAAKAAIEASAPGVRDTDRSGGGGQPEPPRTRGGSPPHRQEARSVGGRAESRAVTLQSTVVPGLKEFVDEDLVPGVKAAIAEMGQAKVGIRELFAPDTVDTHAGVMAGIMRSNLAASAQRQQKLQRELRTVEKWFDRQSKPHNLAFIDAIETGAIAELPENLRPIATRLREVLAAKRAEATKRGLMRGYIEHYFPHEWAEPSKVKQALRALFGKRPLQGKEAYRKKRSIPTVKDGIAAGLEPVSYNPVTLVLRKLVEMDKSITAYDILREGKQLRVAKFVPVGRASKTKKPEGWVRYPDSFGTVYGPPTVTVHEAYDERRMTALRTFAKDLGIDVGRKVNLPGHPSAWGYAEQGTHRVMTKFGGPEKVLEHEIGHVLDWKYGLWRTISDQLKANPKTKRKSRAFELRALADLRFEGIEPDKVPAAFKEYVRRREEKMANLVNAYLHNPQRAKEVAPTSYWALHNLIKDHDELRPLIEIQATRGLVLGTNQAEVPVGGLVIKGHYHGPPSAVRLLANYLSPGLRGNAAYDLYRWTGNFLNQVQLGLSAFHLTTTAFNSIFSKGAIALQLASRGEIVESLKKTAEIPFAPLVDVVRGHYAVRKFQTADVNARVLRDEIDAAIQAGSRVGWDKFWHDSASERFMQALRSGNYPGAALRALPAVFDVTMKPVMEWWVPRLKMAAFLDLARMELRELGEHPERREVRRVLGAAQDSIDNRFGELAYDNLFWHPLLKDAGMATVRAMGWSLGTVREVFGAPSAQLRQFGALPGAGGGGFKPPTRAHFTGFDEEEKPQYEDRRAPWLTNKFAYLTSLLFLSAIYGAVYQYAHTGRKPGEREDGTVDPSTRLLDLYFPQTGGTLPDGRPERAALPTYMKDVVAFGHDFPDSAVTAVHGKLHPMWNLLAELIKNQDAFGTEVRNREDPALQQLEQFFEHAARAYKPISISNYVRRKESQDRTGVSGAESAFGIGVAPRYVTQTPAEKLIREYLPPATHTLEQEAQSKDRLAIRLGLRARTPEGRDAARATAAEGHLSAKQLQRTVHDAPLTSLQKGFQALTLKQALNVYRAASPAERAVLWPLLGKKVQNASVAPADRDRLKAAVQGVRTLPRSE